MALGGKLALEEAMVLSQDELRNEWIPGRIHPFTGHEGPLGE